MLEFKLDKNIPIPRAKLGRPPKYKWDLMEVGDSFFLPRTAHYAGRLVQARKAAGDKNTYMVRGIRENGKDGARIWRTK